MVGYSCQEEYEYDMSCQAEADAMAAAEGQRTNAVIEAMDFLVSEGVEPNHYKSFYEQNKRRNDLSVSP